MQPRPATSSAASPKTSSAATRTAERPAPKAKFSLEARSGPVPKPLRLAEGPRVDDAWPRPRVEPGRVREERRVSVDEQEPRDRREEALAPFQPPPAILGAPAAAAAPSAAIAARSSTEIGAWVERVMTSLSVGDVGPRGKAVRMRLAIGGPGEVEVRVQEVDGKLAAVFAAEDPRQRAAAERLAATLARELAARGIEVGEIRVDEP